MASCTSSLLSHFPRLHPLASTPFGHTAEALGLPGPLHLQLPFRLPFGASKDLGHVLDRAAGAARDASTYLYSATSRLSAPGSFSKSWEPLFCSTLNLSRTQLSPLRATLALPHLHKDLLKSHGAQSLEIALPVVVLIIHTPHHPGKRSLKSLKSPRGVGRRRLGLHLLLAMLVTVQPHQPARSTALLRLKQGFPLAQHLPFQLHLLCERLNLLLQRRWRVPLRELPLASQAAMSSTSHIP